MEYPNIDNSNEVNNFNDVENYSDVVSSSKIVRLPKVRAKDKDNPDYPVGDGCSSSQQGWSWQKAKSMCGEYNSVGQYEVPKGYWTPELCNLMIPNTSQRAEALNAGYPGVWEGQVKNEWNYLGTPGGDCGLSSDQDCQYNGQMYAQWNGLSAFPLPTPDQNQWINYASRCDQPYIYECNKWHMMEGTTQPYGGYLSPQLEARYQQEGINWYGTGISVPREGWKWGVGNEGDNDPIEMGIHPQGLDFVIPPGTTGTSVGMMKDRANVNQCANLIPINQADICHWNSFYDTLADDPVPGCQDRGNKMKDNANFEKIAAVPGTDLPAWFYDADFHAGPNSDSMSGDTQAPKGLSSSILLSKQPNYGDKWPKGHEKGTGPANYLPFWSGNIGTQHGGDLTHYSNIYSAKPMQSYPCPDMGIDKQANVWTTNPGLAMRNRATSFQISDASSDKWNCGENDQIPRWKQNCAYSKSFMGGASKPQIDSLNCYLLANTNDSIGNLTDGISPSDYNELMANLCFGTSTPTCGESHVESCCPTGGNWDTGAWDCPVMMEKSLTGAMCRQWSRQPCASSTDYHEETANTNGAPWPVCVGNCCDNDAASGLPGCGYKDDIIEGNKSPTDNRSTPGDILMREYCANKRAQGINHPACDCINAVYGGDSGPYGEAYKTLRNALDLGGISGPQCWFQPCSTGVGVYNTADISTSAAWDGAANEIPVLLTSAELNPAARAQLREATSGGTCSNAGWVDTDPCCAPLPQCVNIIGLDDDIAMAGGDVSQYAKCEGTEGSGSITYWTKIKEGVLSQGACKSVRPCDCKNILLKTGTYLSPGDRSDDSKCLDGTATIGCPRGCATDTEGGKALDDNYAYDMCWEGSRNKTDCTKETSPTGYCNCVACSAPRYSCKYNETPDASGNHWYCSDECNMDPTSHTCPAECVIQKIQTEDQCEAQVCQDYWKCDNNLGQCVVSDEPTDFFGKDAQQRCQEHWQKVGCGCSNRWKCDESQGQCICTTDTGEETYDTYAECASSEDKCPGKWACDSTSTCVSDRNGDYSTQDDCIVQCGGGWVCDSKTKTCSLSTEGSPYGTEADCLSACTLPSRLQFLAKKAWDNKYMIVSIILTFVIVMSFLYKSRKRIKLRRKGNKF